MSKNNSLANTLDATYIAPIIPKFTNVRDAFLSNAYKPYILALLASADTHRQVLVPIPETFRMENGQPTVDYVTIDVRGTGSPMLNINPEFALITLGSNAGMQLIDKATGLVYNILGLTGRNVAKSILAGEAINQIGKATTGKTFGLNVRLVVVTPKIVLEHTPEIVKDLVSEGLNPAYGGIKPAISISKALNAKLPKSGILVPVFMNWARLFKQTPLPIMTNLNGTYAFGNGSVANTKLQGLQALAFLKQVYASPLYKLRVLLAYPSWSEQKVNAFIQERINKINQAAQKLVVNKSTANLGDTGRTWISQSATALEPIGIEVAYDVNDPFLVALHEGLHFSSLGGRVPLGYYLNPNALAIANHNAKILPKLTRSWYKKYIESSTPEEVKRQYLLAMHKEFPYLNASLLEDMFLHSMKLGAFYNMEEELRSYGLAELLESYAKGEIKDINNPLIVEQWLINKYNSRTLSDKLTKILEDYRPNFKLWANYLAKALSIGTVPIILSLRKNE